MCSLNNLSITFWWCEYKAASALVISLQKIFSFLFRLNPRIMETQFFAELSYAVNGIGVFESGHNSKG